MIWTIPPGLRPRASILVHLNFIESRVKKMLKIRSRQDGVESSRGELRSFHGFPLWFPIVGVPGSIVVTQCVRPAPIVLLSAEIGVVAPRPIVLYGPLMVFYGSPRILPRDLGGVETPAQRRITRGSPPSSHSLNFTLSLNAISPDLPRSFSSAHKETPLKRIIFFKNRLVNILKRWLWVVSYWASKVVLCILWTQC